MVLFRRIGVSLLAMAGLAFMALSFSSMAQGQGKKDFGKKDGPAIKPAPGRVNWNETKVAFDMRGKTWDATIKWFCQQVQMPLSGKYPPPNGTISFYNVNGPDGKPREFTLVEVFDLLNEMLMSEHKHILLRRETTLMIVPADEPIEKILIPWVTVEELPNRGRTEIVIVTLTLKGDLNASDFAPSAKRLLGHWAVVTPIDETNQLIVQCDVYSILRNLRILTGKSPPLPVKLDEKGNPVPPPKEGPPEDQSAHIHSHKCVYLRATAAEAILLKSLGNLQETIIIQGARPTGPTDNKDAQPGGVPVKGPGGPGGGPGGGGPRGDGGGPGGGVRLQRVTTVSTDKATNTVIISGPTAKIELAKTVLANIDKPRSPTDKGILVGPPLFKTHEVPQGNAEAFAKVLADIYKDDPSIRIQVNPPSRLFVYADPQTHFEINLLVNSEPPAVQKVRLIILQQMDARSFSDSLKSMFPDRSLFIEPDMERNGIRLRGTPEQIKSVEEVIQQLDGGQAVMSGTSRMINLDKGSAVTVAEALNLLFPSIRDNPLTVVKPGDPLENIKPKKEEPKKPEAAPPTESVPMPKRQTKAPRTGPDSLRQAIQEGAAPAKYQPVSFVQEGKLAEIQPKKEPNKKKSPVVITAFGNRILITSEDPEALDVLQQMIRILVNTEANPGDIVVLKLTNANAIDVAKILDEAFNGVKMPGGGGGGPGGGQRGGGAAPGGGAIGFSIPGILGSMLGGGGQPAGGAPTARSENIRVVADPGTNSLLIKAKPIDLMTIRRLLANSLDKRDTESQQAFKDFVIGPLKNAQAPAVAEILEKIYHDSLNSRFQSTSSAVLPGGGSFFNSQRGVEPSTNNTSLLSVAVDMTNNSIVVRCPTTIYKDIERLVKEIDQAAAENKQVVKVVPMTDIDPYLLQAAIDAISGKQSAQAQRGTFGSTMGPGAFAPGNFGGPGRTPGGNFGGGNFGGGGGNFGGGGFNPGGGGFNPGGGGFNPGGFNPGGGGAVGAPGGRGPGGGGAAPTGGGGGFRGGGGAGGRGGPGGMQSRGPDFFGQRVKDDPLVSPLYDPFEESELPAVAQIAPKNDNEPVIPVYTANPFYFTSYLQPEEKLQPEIPEKVPPPKGAEGTIVAPRLPVVVQPLATGDLMLRGDPKDIAAVMEIINVLKQRALGAKPEIRLIPVRLGDPTQIVGQLNQLLSKVRIDPYYTEFIQGGPGGAPGGPGAAGGAQPAPLGIVLLPQPRLSAILVAAPASRMNDIIGYIQQLDTAHSDAFTPVIIPLKHAPATQVANALIAFYITGATNRFSPPDPAGYNQIRIWAEVRTNSVVVQASPADLAGIKSLIEHIDNPDSNLAKNDMRVVGLKNAVAVDMAQLLTASIANGVLTAPVPGVTAAAPAAAATPGGLPAGPAPTKDQSVRFVSSRDQNGKPVQSSILEDIRVNPDVRTNSLVISAPRDTMPLILALIAELDVPPNARMEINIFTLKKTDATMMAQMLQQLFMGVTGAIGATPTGGGGAPAGGLTGGLGAAGTAGSTRPIQITIQSSVPEGPPIIDLRLTVDLRTNSLIIAGSRNDLNVVASIIGRIEDAKIPERCTQVVRLRNQQAVDLVNALQTYVTGVTTIYKTYGYGTASLEPNREIVLVAEPITNSVIVDAIPSEFDKILKMISQLDTQPPQVVVSVLIAQVTLNGEEEFGVELGLQSPLEFARSLVPGTSTVTYTTTATAPTTGFAATAIANTAGQVVAGNGYGPNFNNGVPASAQVFGLNTPGQLGYQGLTNFGVGRTSSTSGVGGFVFTAQSGFVNVLLRALKTQERLTVLSRPNVQTQDKQAAVVSVGQQIPINSGSNATAVGTISVAIIRQTVGVILQVTPSIGADGRINMRVIPEVSAVASTAFPLGDGTFSTSLSIQHLETTVSADDGETVLLGGLITKQSDKNEVKAPWLGDLPGIGALFRYRTEATTQTELLIIMTPHIVRNRQEGERFLAEEARRMDWVVGDVMRVHGTPNSGPFVPPPPPPQPQDVQPFRIIPNRQPNGMPGGLPQMQPGCCAPQGPMLAPVPMPGPTPNGFEAPAPKTLPPASQASPQGTPGIVMMGADGPTSRIVMPAKAAPVSLPSSTVAPPAALPAGPPNVAPAPMPIASPQELQVQAPPSFVVPPLAPPPGLFADKK